MEILFGGNFDLYWNCYYREDVLEHDDISFNITKENYYLYSLIEELYNNIKNYEIISVARREKISESNNRPFGNFVERHSDDFAYDVVSVLRIEEFKDSYKIIFSESRDKNNFETYSIRFRNRGSRYSKYNFFFMKMYNELCLYDSNYHQMYMEEYLYSKNKCKVKKY